MNIVVRIAITYMPIFSTKLSLYLTSPGQALPQYSQWDPQRLNMECNTASQWQAIIETTEEHFRLRF